MLSENRANSEAHQEKQRRFTACCPLYDVGLVFLFSGLAVALGLLKFYFYDREHFRHIHLGRFDGWRSVAASPLRIGATRTIIQD